VRVRARAVASSTVRDSTVQETLEKSIAGRVLLSVGVLIVVASLVIVNLPESQLRRDVVRPARAIAIGTSLEQSWGVFAPDPRRQVIELEARLRFADGTTRVWHPPSSGRSWGAYRTYRWRKWVENARSDDNKSLWEPTALFAARQFAHAGRFPVTVSLVRRWYDLAPPGAVHAGHAPWQEFSYYTVQLGSDFKPVETP